MAPPKEACEILAIPVNVQAEIIEKYLKIRDTIRKVLEILAKIKYGIANISSLIGSELLAVVKSVASQLAKALLGQLSQAIAALLQAILKELLEFLMGYPKLVFALVAIPHKSATDSARNERMSLNRARGNMDVILSIIKKWGKKKINKAQYYAQIVKAMPALKRSIDALNSVIEGLEGVPDEDTGDLNSSFDEAKYSVARINLKKAIKELEPTARTSVAANLLQATDTSVQQFMAKETTKINKEYVVRKSTIDATFQTESQAAKNEIESSKAGQKWKRGIDSLDMWRRERMVVAEINARKHALTNGSMYKKIIGGPIKEFKFDMERIADELDEFADNIKKAYIFNKKCHLACNSIVKMKSIITKLISFIITALQKIGNNAAGVLNRGLTRASSMMETAYEHMADIHDRVKQREDVTAAEMAIKVSTSSALCISSDALMSAIVVESLIDLINSDTLIKESDEDYQLLLTNLRKVKDWNSSDKAWADKLIGGNVSPYLGMVVASRALLLRLPMMAIGGSRRSKKKITEKIRELYGKYKTTKAHNDAVQSALLTYKAWQPPQITKLIKILSALGRLGALFGAAMDLAALIKDMIEMVQQAADEEVPTLDLCMRYYPDLFQTGTGKMVATEMATIPEPVTNLENLNRIENSMLRVHDLNFRARRKSIRAKNAMNNMLNGSESPIPVA